MLRRLSQIHLQAVMTVIAVVVGFAGASASAKVVKRAAHKVPLLKGVRRAKGPTPAQRAARAAADAAATKRRLGNEAALRKANPNDSEVTSDARIQMSRSGGIAGNAFCYAIDNGKIQGVNPDQPVRIASVMKVLTTFWAIESFTDAGGPNHRWSTKIFVQPGTKTMHIQGSRDPFFDRDRLYLLISDLNKIGIKDFTRITADKNFWMNMDATEWQYSGGQIHAENHVARSLAAGDIAEKLENSFNSDKWWSARKGRYLSIKSRNANTGMTANLEMKVNSTAVVDENPLKGQPGVLEFTIQSAPLRLYLKQMNIMSINPVADELFHSLGGSKAFEAFMQKRYGMGAAVADVQTGSGLPLFAPTRNDTSVSCSNVVKIIRQMDNDLESKFHMDLADVMMASGIDTQPHATFSEKSRSLVVKTGTLTGASNLAGVAETSAGEVYFGIFMGHKYETVAVLRQMQMNFRAKAIARSATPRFDGIDTDMQLKKITPSPAKPVAITKG